MNRKITLITCLVCSALLSRAAYVPATVTGGYNQDVIANGVGPGSPNQAAASTTSAFDIPNNYALLSADYQVDAVTAAYPNALPVGGVLSSTSTPGLSYQLGDYSLLNTLFLTKTNTTGTLTISNANNVSEVYLLTAAANGAVTFSATVTFTDLTEQIFTSQTAKDWFNQTPFVINNLNRVNTTNGNVQVTANNPRLYEVKLTLSAANVGKTIASITINASIGATSNSTMGLFAVSTATACSAAPLAATISGTTSVCPGSSVTYTAANPAGNTGGITYQWQTSPPGANVWTDVTGATGTTYTATISSPVDIRYVATCPTASLSTPSNVLQVVLSFCYCTPTYSNNCTFSNKINTVTIDAYTDPTATSVCAPASVPTVALTINTTPQVTVTTGGFIGISAAVDVNNNGTLSDAGDLAFPQTYTSGSATYTFNLPNISTPGTYRLRVWCAGANAGSGTSTTFLPCDGYSYGNYRDYDLVYSFPLQIKLTDIQASNTGGSNIVSWQIASADEGDVFELERSQNGADFKTLTSIKANAAQTNYSYQDEKPFRGVSYYRLKMVNRDGTAAYSKTVSANTNIKGQLFSVYPNPARNVLYIQGDGGGNGNIAITNTLGQVAMQQVLSSNEIDISQLPKGVYVIKLVNGQGSQTVSFIKE